MRHLKGNKKLSKPTDQRLALLRAIVKSLVEHKRIKTTDTRAKEARRLAETLVTYGKDGSLHSRRLALKLLPNKAVIDCVFKDLAPRYKDRNGGYTRLTKVGFRQGDAATLSLLEFLE